MQRLILTLKSVAVPEHLPHNQYSVTAVINRNGTVDERYAYSPYGETTVLNSGYVQNNNNLSTIDNEYTYTGRRLDPSGLMYFRARYYSPQLGQFISRDPLGYVDGMSQYRAYFVPEATDPWGLETLTKHYSRHKDQTWVSGYDEDAEGAVPKKSPSYEVVYQVVTLSVDGSSCFETNYCHEEPGCGGSFEASLSVTTTNSSIGGNTGYVPSAGIYDPNQDVFSGSKKTEKGDGAGGSIKIGDKYFSELTLGNDLDCSESFARDVYFTLPSAKATGEVNGTHHKISLSVIPRVGECGKFDLFLDMSINDPAVAEGQGKYLMELTGPNDPNRPEYGHTNN